MTVSFTVRRLLDDLNESLQRIESHYAHDPSVILRGLPLRRRRAVSVLHRQMRMLRCPQTRPVTLPGTGVADLIAGERRLIDSFRAALTEAQANPALHHLLTAQKSETEQALLAFSLLLRSS